MASDEKWYFTKEQLENTPSRQCNIDVHRELFYRQQAANFIQDMGQKLRVSQLCINTATVYMHRFYVFHSFTHFPWHSIAAAALFLSAKVEEQPRKLEHVVKVYNICRYPQNTNIDAKSEKFQQQAHDLVYNENVLLQTLGFDVAIDHPHAHVVRCCQLVKASKDLAQTSYFMASTSLQLTTMCLQYKPSLVACFCIHLACKWSNWEIPLSSEQKEWFLYVDKSVTAELLAQLTDEFLVIFERCPSKLKGKIMSISEGHNTLKPSSHPQLSIDSQSQRQLQQHQMDMKDPHRSAHVKTSSSAQRDQREREYREKKERERMMSHQSKQPMPHPNPNKPQPNVSHSSSSHHKQLVDMKMKPHPRPPSSTGSSHPIATNRPDKDNAIRDPHSRDHARVSDVTDSNKDMQVSSDKELDKRAYLMKPNVNNELNNVTQISHGNHSSSSDKQRPDASQRQRMPQDPKLMQQQQQQQQQHKHDLLRRHDDQKMQQHDVRKQHSNSSSSSSSTSSSNWYDKNAYDKYNMHMKQMANQVPQTKKKSPFAPDASKSVPKSSSIKQESYNGSNSSSSSNGGYAVPIKEELIINKQDEHYPVPVKKPSMFSPEKTPPRKQPIISNNVKRPMDNLPISKNIPGLISSLDSHIDEKRMKTEPTDQFRSGKINKPIEGFENILRDSTVGMKPQVPDIINDNQSMINVQQHNNISKELKPPDIIPPFSTSNTSNVPLSQPIVNGIETNPTLISNLLKEAPTVPRLPTISGTNSSSNHNQSVNVVNDEPAPPAETDSSKDHSHSKDRKKKNKEKHKHKDKHDDKEKKKKHKDKDKEKHKSKHRDKHKVEEQPIKITIPKDKIQSADVQPPQPPPITPGGGLKIKIPKDRIKSDMIGESSAPVPPPPAPGIKIKIPKDVISMGNNDTSSGSKKRDRDKLTSPGDVPPTKVPKSSYNRQQHGDKQNGRSSFGKVAQMGDGDTSIHRLTESKYINKGASA